ncbi:ATP synthase subunit 4, mitochondrial [Nakaseomyces bracarensis]|uniref:ATP synthase subunit 4 n=1 Tax=Nakaseomyces bracarensis TaxID=273131 RepID=A0ABR4NXZ5_9SACH
MLRAISMRTASRAALSQSMRSARLTPVLSMRYNSTKTPDAKSKAASLIDALPGNTVLTKTGILGTSAAAIIYGISNQLYVINDESILLLIFLGFSGLVAKFLAPMYKDFADSRIKKIGDILNSSRVRHVDAVKDRIESVSELQNVSETTKVLFDVSKETVELEAKAFELKQQVELAHEAKSVLDSWVRYEASLRQLQQKQLAEAIISKVENELTNPKFQDKILQQSITEVEQVLANIK